MAFILKKITPTFSFIQLALSLIYTPPFNRDTKNKRDALVTRLFYRALSLN
jgi:hypothetical protein